MPNGLTLSRFGPLYLFYRYRNHEYLGLVWGSVWCLVDVVDGYAARKLNQVTLLGGKLDYAADHLGYVLLIYMLSTTFTSFKRRCAANVQIAFSLYSMYLTLSDAYKVRHTTNEYRLVRWYNANNLRNPFAALLLGNSIGTTYFLYRRYSPALDAVYLVLEGVMACICVLRTI